VFFPFITAMSIAGNAALSASEEAVSTAWISQSAPNMAAVQGKFYFSQVARCGGSFQLGS
jgi:hypothetical protein